jgi:hypothetical protein
LFQKNQKQGWWSGSSGKSTCLVSVRLQVQTPVLKKNKVEKSPKNNKKSFELINLPHILVPACAPPIQPPYFGIFKK